MQTARAKGTSRTTWDQWRTTNAIIQGRNKGVKPPISEVDKFVKKRKIQNLVHRTSRTGKLYLTDLKTGEEVEVQLTREKRGNHMVATTSQIMDSRQYAYIGVDVEVQRALVNKFNHAFTFDEVFYCQEHPEFMIRLMQYAVPYSMFSSYNEWHYQVTLQKLVDWPELLRDLPGKRGHIPIIAESECDIEHVKLATQWFNEAMGNNEKSSIGKELKQFRQQNIQFSYLCLLELFFYELITIEDFHKHKESFPFYK